MTKKQTIGTKKDGTPAGTPKKKDTPAKAEPKPKTTATPEDLAWAHAELNRLVPPTRPCGDGCGAEVKGRFLPGHDARLLSRLLQERLGKAKAA